MTQLQRRQRAKLKQLASSGPFLAASLCVVNRRCGQPNCRCAKGQPHQAHVLTYKVKGKTKTIHVPKDRLQEVRRWTEEYKRVKKLMQEISELSLERLRHETLVKRAARRGRKKPLP